jgi:hypothetical protein
VIVNERCASTYIAGAVHVVTGMVFVAGPPSMTMNSTPNMQGPTITASGLYTKKYVQHPKLPVIQYFGHRTIKQWTFTTELRLISM